MHVRCPHCQNPLEIVGESTFRDMECPSCGSHFSLLGNDAPTEVGTSKPRRLAHFDLIEQLGVGYFGAVWKAKDTTLDRFVAVKVPRAEQLDETDIEKFFREARAAAQLRHPNIVAVHEVGRDENTVFIASEFVDGATLQEWLRGKPLPPREAAALCVKLADALHVAHEAGVIHRDLKPSNIMMDAVGEPHIMDFGLAKRSSGEITMTIDGAVLGTPAYMPPEQAAGKGHEADRRSDVHSLGVVLYQMLTGTLPFRGEKRMLLMQIQHDEPQSPRRLNGHISPDLETICLKCLEKDPGRRYRTSGELADDLRRFLNGEPIQARPVGSFGRAWRWSKRNPRIAALSTSVLLLLLAVAIGSSVSALVIKQKELQAIDARNEAETARVAETSQRKRAELAEKEARASETVAKEREAAEAEARKAEQKQKELAQASQAQAESYLASTYVGNGQRFANEGDMFTSLIWFAQALDLESKHADRELRHRIRLGAYMRQCPTLSLALSFQRPVMQAEFTADGKRVATISGNYARVWDATTGEPVSKKLEHEAYGLLHLDLSPDGKLLAAGGDTLNEHNDIHVWRVDSGELAFEPIHTKALVQHIEFSPDGQRLLVATGPDRNSVGESRILMVDAANGQTLPLQITESDHLTHVAFSPDGGTIIVVRQRLPAQVSLWDVHTGKLRQPPVIVGDNSAEADFATISRDGLRLVATGNMFVDNPRLTSSRRGGIARVWDLTANKPVTLQLPHRRSVTCAAFSPDDRLVATATGNELDGNGTYEAWVWNATTGLPAVPPLRHSAAVTSVQFSPDGTALLTASKDGTVRVWDVFTGEPLTPPMHGPLGVGDSSFSPDGARILMACGERYGDAGEVRVWDWRMASRNEGFTAPFTNVLFSPDGQKAVSFPGNGIYPAEASNRAHLIDLSNRGQHIPLSHNGQAYYAGFSSDSRLLATGTGNPPAVGRTAAATNASFGEAQIWDAATGEPVGLAMKHTSPVVFTEMSPDGRLLFTVTQQSFNAPQGSYRVSLWDVDSRNRLIDDKELAFTFSDACFSPDGKRIVIEALSGIEILDTESKVIQKADLKFGGGSSGGVSRPQRRIAMAPDGSRALICIGGDEALFLDLHSLTQVGPRLTGKRISHVAFHPNGKAVLAANETDVRLFHAQTGELLAPPLVHEALVEFADFALEGRIVVTASRDYSVRVWDAQTGERLTPPFAHPSFVQQAQVSADGTRLLSQCHASILSSDLSPVVGSNSDLKDWIELVACRQINKQGHMVPVRQSAKPTVPQTADSKPTEIPDRTNPDWVRLHGLYAGFFGTTQQPPQPREIATESTPPAAVSEESLERLEQQGEAALNDGDVPEAQRIFQLLHDGCQRLLANDAEDRRLKRWQWISYYWLGKTHAKTNDVHEAEHDLTKSKELCTELISSDPADQKAVAELQYPVLALSRLRQANGDFEDAEQQLQPLLTMYETLRNSAAPEDVVLQAYIAALQELQRVHVLKGDMESAAAVKFRVVDLRQQRLRQGAGGPDERSMLVRELLEMSRTAWNLGDVEGATLQIREIWKVFDQYRDLGPQTDANGGRLLVDLRDALLATVLMRDNDLTHIAFQVGLELAKPALEQNTSSEGLYNLACLYSLYAGAVAAEEQSECIESAVAALRRSVELGYWNWQHIEQDSDLDAIRTHPGYQEILADLKKTSESRVTSPPSAK